MGLDDLESIRETLAILGDRDALRELADAHCAHAEGDVVRGVKSVRALGP